VKVRSYKFKQQRNRKVLLALCKLMLVSSVVIGAFYGGRECLNRLFWHNPDYNLATIEINDDGMLSREQIIAAAGIAEGKNIFSVNLTKVRESLSQLPQVDRVDIERTLPAKITISITERKPVAWLAPHASEDPTASDDSFLIDRKGTLIKTKKELPEYFHLPVIYGFSTDNLDAGQVLDAVEIKSALTLIDMNGDNTRFRIRSIDLSKGYCMTVSDQSHMKITFGLDHIEDQIDRLALLLDHVDGTNKIIQTANLMFEVERNIPVTFADPSSEQEVDPAPGQPPLDKPAAAPVTAPATLVKPQAAPKKPAAPAAKPHLKPKSTPVPVRRALPVGY
jgi:cell division septal protein FtsQ